MKNSNKILLFNIMLAGLLITGVSLADIAIAHTGTGTDAFWRPGQPIVPCAGTPQTPDPFGRPPCNYCQILHLTRHLIDFIMIAAAPILATAFFLYAGVLMMVGGANPSMLAQGKRIFKDTMIGLLIVMLAWLITNTVVRTLGNPSSVTNWYQFECSVVN